MMNALHVYILTNQVVSRKLHARTGPGWGFLHLTVASAHTGAHIQSLCELNILLYCTHKTSKHPQCYKCA